jgi:hypothetical protein
LAGYLTDVPNEPEARDPSRDGMDDE